jgi:hypothetical protein
MLETASKKYNPRKGQIMGKTKSCNLARVAVFPMGEWNCVNLVNCRFNRRKGLRSIAACTACNKLKQK